MEFSQMPEFRSSIERKSPELQMPIFMKGRKQIINMTYDNTEVCVYDEDYSKYNHIRIDVDEETSILIFFEDEQTIRQADVLTDMLYPFAASKYPDKIVERTWQELQIDKFRRGLDQDLDGI